MAKETTVNVETGIVKTTFSTKCNSVETELNISFDFSNLTQEQVYELALRSAIIDFQRTIRPLTQNEAIEKYDGTVVIVGEKRKRVVSLSVKALQKFNKGETLTKDEAAALLDALKGVQTKVETDEEFTISK